jgi:protein-tyrosine phosphatase
VASASLILGMTAEHRKAAAKLDPRAARRSFTLLEFARLLALPQLLDDVVRDRRESGDGAGDPIASLDSFVSTVAASRGYLPPPAHASDLDITDPYGRSAKVYAQVASIIGEATTTLADSFVSVVKQT